MAVGVTATVEVFDPPLCCSTGVCGPSVDPALAEFAADLAWLAELGVAVARHNLSQEPGAFAEQAVVRELLAERGNEGLPAVLVDGELASSGRYPARDELAAWALRTAGGALDAVTTELVAIGAALGANCEPCLEYHVARARRLGVSAEAMAAAVRVAQAVKDTPARSVLELASKLLHTGADTLRGAATAAATTTATTTTTAPSSAPDDAAAGAAGAGCCGGPADGAVEAGPDPAGQDASGGCCSGDAEAVDVALVATAAPSGPSGCCG
jgi:AhpD family alkylhydroperoxidase